MFSRRRLRPRRTWPQRIFLLLGIVVIAASVTTVFALDYGDAKVGELPRVELGPVLAADPETSNEPRNFLLVGLDSIASLDPDDPLRVGREEDNLLTDTLILLRVEPDTGNATMLSLPRDLWVPIAGAGYEQKINAAMSIGGAETLVQTISEALDIPIHHFVQVDFRGFREVVDVVGGVPIWFDIPLRDDRVGFLYEEPGCYVLDADESLKYVRSRAMQGQIDGRWQYLDLAPDLGRISRQQDFLVSAMRTAIAKGGLRHPGTSIELVDAAIGSVTIDELLTPRDLVDLADEFSAFSPDELGRSTLPVYDDLAGGLEILRILEADAEPLLEVFRGAGIVGLSAEGVRIAVLNGTGAPNLATDVAAQLGEAGFNTPRLGDAATFDNSRTILRFHPDDRAQVELFLSYAVTEPILEEVLAVADARLELVVGADWEGLRAVPEALSEQITTDEKATSAPTVEATATPAVPVEAPDDGLTEEERAAQAELEAARQACVG
jgi:LCP family protein required for cell wall assembly